MTVKGRWQDWAAIAAGVLLAVSWIWHGMLGPQKAALFVLALLIVLAATMSITHPGMLAGEGFIFGLGALVFLSPWLTGFAGTNAAAAWTAWILGAVVMVAGAAGIVQVGRSGGVRGRPVAH
ncbi:SPW repeat domain-containing protein [Nocardiopsis composta]|uniref:Apolipoprotein N-acyltransferase n=1 Tax=Nocardiopsis composta TaxID=157465 RepID=A0A7W8QRZ0_9ACTN|nr:SPW repeat protein [Nocardiopsis composta]MBB5434805.1 apolipoprotein N-acyltransferase [Nocardiopsis composta]